MNSEARALKNEIVYSFTLCDELLIVLLGGAPKEEGVENVWILGGGTGAVKDIKMLIRGEDLLPYGIDGPGHSPSQSL